MADIKATSLGGVPKGTTAQRPTSPAVGDVYYNGTLGCLEIYTSVGWVANSAPPAIPIIGTTTYSATNKAYNNSSASVAFTPGEGGGLPNSYRATSTPGGFTGTASSSPITVEGLQSATTYTFSVTGTNNFGTSAGSINSNSITANTVPQAPTIGVLSYVSSTSLSLAFTSGATGGSSITNYKYSTDGTNYTALSPAQTSSPLLISGLTPLTNYAFYVKAVNANGDSLPSLISNSVLTGTIVTGGTLSSDATYYYRSFTSTGTLGFSGAPITTDILTIAGGGAGGSGSRAAAGGAGGLVYSSSVSISSNQTVTVGAGGSAGVWNDSNILGGSTSGSNSRFGSQTEAIGGGKGGSYDSGGQASGGSGGGGWYLNGGGTGTAGQGNNGAAGYSSPNYGGGGGGGAGSAGSQGTASTGGAGGAGVSSYSSWGSATSYGHNVSGTYWFAGGGSGDIYGQYGTQPGTPGNGGGGTGRNPQGSVSSACNGLDYSGGGGGSNGSGGKGIVIVRYLKSAAVG